VERKQRTDKGLYDGDAFLLPMFVELFWSGWLPGDKKEDGVEHDESRALREQYREDLRDV